MRNILIYSDVANWANHHAQTIELAITHFENGDNVYILRCMGQLSCCPANPVHSKSMCLNCRSQSRYVEDEILPKYITFLELVIDRKIVNIPDFHSQEDFESFEYDSVPLGRLALSQLFDDYNDRFLDLAVLNTRGKLLLLDGVSLYSTGLNVINHFSIDTVYVWNGRRNCDGPLHFAALKLGKDSYSYISGGNLSKFLVQPKSNHSLANWHNDLLKFRNQEYKNSDFIQEQAKLFYDSQRYGGSPTLGQIHFAYGQTEELQFDSSRLNLVIYTASPWENYSLHDYTPLGPDFSDFYALIEAIHRDLEIRSKYQIYVRWHPNMKNGGRNEKNLMHKIISHTPEIIHIPPDSSVNSYALLDGADVVLTNGSTMGAEATYYGKPSILVGPAYYSCLQISYSPRSMSELKELLFSHLHPRPKFDSEIFGAFMVNFGKDFSAIELDQHFRYVYQGKDVLGKLKIYQKPLALMFHILERFGKFWTTSV